MITINATSESAPQEINTWKTYYNSSLWIGLRLVCWIGQDISEKTTTLYFKWQKSTGGGGVSAYENNYHTFRIRLSTGDEVENQFQLGSIKGTSWSDIFTQHITVSRLSELSQGSMDVSGYKFYTQYNPNQSFSDTFEFTLADIPAGEFDPDDAPAEYDDATGQRYYIYYDGEVIYNTLSANKIVTEPKLDLVMNEKSSLSFYMPPSNTFHDIITPLQKPIEVKQGMDVLYRGRILDLEHDFDTGISVNSEGVLVYLNDIRYESFSFSGPARELFERVLNYYNSKISDAWNWRKIKFVSSDITQEIVYDEQGRMGCGELIADILNQTSAYLRIEYYDDGSTGLSMVSSYNTNCSQTIELGINLFDFKMLIDGSNLYTVVIPIGKDDLRLPEGELVNEEAVALFGRIEKDFENSNISNTSELREYGQIALRAGINLVPSFSINALDLHLIDKNVERIRFGSSCRVYSPKHGIDARYICSKIELDMEDAANTVYTFGKTFESLSQMIEYNKK